MPLSGLPTLAYPRLKLYFVGRIRNQDGRHRLGRDVLKLLFGQRPSRILRGRFVPILPSPAQEDKMGTVGLVFDGFKGLPVLNHQRIVTWIGVDSGQYRM
jgi:hypothetical protein